MSESITSTTSSSHASTSTGSANLMLSAASTAGPGGVVLVCSCEFGQPASEPSSDSEHWHSEPPLRDSLAESDSESDVLQNHFSLMLILRLRHGLGVTCVIL